MSRVGRNPLTEQQAPSQFPPVLLAVITHLPEQKGYHAQRWEIVSDCLLSLRETAPDVPLLIWDNGSCREFQDWLVLQGEWFIKSPNVGKQAARAAILKMLPPKTIVAICDDDFHFESGWLEAHLQLLQGFPNVGMVSGFAARFSFGWGVDGTLEWAHAHAGLDIGRFLTDAQEMEYADSIGGSAERIAARLAHQQDYRVRYNGLTAYAQAQHAQFMCYAGRISPLCEYKREALGEERSFDEAVDKAGLLRLATVKQYTRHMGNVK